MANNIEKLLACLVSPAQDVEDALQQLRTERFVDTAVGAQLDVIGRIVGQLREGLSDADYRRYIRARIAANNSDGTVDDLLTVAWLVVYDQAVTIKLEQHGNATVVIKLQAAPVTSTIADILIRFLDRAAAAGVRIIIEYSDQPVNTWFVWDTPSQGWDNGKLLDAKDNSGTEGS